MPWLITYADIFFKRTSYSVKQYFVMLTDQNEIINNEKMAKNLSIRFLVKKNMKVSSDVCDSLST